MVAGGAPMSGAYTLESLDGGTKLTATGFVEPRGFFKIAEPLFTSMAGRELEASLVHLKELLESRLASIVLKQACEGGAEELARRARRRARQQCRFSRRFHIATLVTR